ncbi:hypothetical protein CHS0354_020247 [Potamilus streckersoni]|uniref:Uncharacterized protein n=1 Tax=Potamilus streckersoni TaxID=2493646 RepID=A0AAE0S5E3_9BIVA|nr:hypothetical protein CHS0354_020247 [Potamilus streckersoni]
MAREEDTSKIIADFIVTIKKTRKCHAYCSGNVYKEDTDYQETRRDSCTAALRRIKNEIKMEGPISDYQESERL